MFGLFNGDSFNHQNINKAALNEEIAVTMLLADS
jgi:hypothetical protein